MTKRLGRWMALLLLAGAPPLVAQAAAPEDVAGTAGEVIDVRVVNVEAVVTDSRGQRIKGLSPADFRLLVDGKEVPIDYFTEVRSGAATAAEGGAGPAAPASGTVGRNLLIFIDQSFAVQAQLDLVLGRLQEDLQQIGPGDQVAVVAADPEGKLRVLSDWSSDPSRLVSILETVRHEPTGGMRLRVALDNIENDKVLRNMADTGNTWGDTSGFGVVDIGHWWDLREATQREGVSTLEHYSRLERSDVSAFADDSFVVSVLAAMRAFSGVPGRKAMLLFSGAWPAGVEPRVAEGANLLGYSLYPVDVAGLQSSPVPVDADRFGAGELGAYGEGAGFITSSWERRVHYGFEVMARDTGGKASLNGLRETALERVLEDTEAYYWLGFSPSWKADGSRHDIKVEVRPRGMRVRARRGYSDLSPRAQQALEEASRRALTAATEETAAPVDGAR